jgi:hypothetical protein
MTEVNVMLATDAQGDPLVIVPGRTYVLTAGELTPEQCAEVARSFTEHTRAACVVLPHDIDLVRELDQDQIRVLTDAVTTEQLRRLRRNGNRS